jgi:hypothetical protein
MDLGTRIVAARIAHAVSKGRALLARHFTRLIEAPRRQVAHEERSVRESEDFWRANNLAPISVYDRNPRGWR